MNRFVMKSLALWIGLLPLIIAGCRPSSSETSGLAKTSSGADKVSLVLNWYPEAEHGGFYAAQVHGIFDKYQLDVEIRPGGKTTIVPQELTLGRIQFGVGNADDVLMAREQSAPLVALLAPMQNGPRSILVREDSGIESFEDLKNVTLQIDPSRPYVPYMKKRGLLSEQVKTVPYFGSVAGLVSDPRTVQQAYCFSEPLMAEQQGVKVKNLMMSEIGYNPYASLLIATESFIQSQPDVTRRMVAACVEGWQKYLQSPDETNAYILKQNPEGMTAEALAYGVEKMRPLCLPENFADDRIGEMTMQRWSTLVDQLKELEMISEKVKPEAAFTTQFLSEP
jgi:NitT/TauT family transport system substrate-binding protein